MTLWENLRPFFPSPWIAALEALPALRRQEVQEIRLRRGRPVTVSLPTGDFYLCRDGLTSLCRQGVLMCDERTLEECFQHFCEDSVYAHEEELRQGYLSVCGGIRVGVAGTAVCQNGSVDTVRDVTALCIRLPRDHRGCASDLLPLLLKDGTVYSSLLVGEPSSGKTSLLRDLAKTLPTRGIRVAVVDERGEIGGVTDLGDCDVLCGYPKAVGIMQAVRCLAPQVILFDELGTQEETAAVAACAHAGVSVIATLHGDTPDTVMWRGGVQQLAQKGVFSRWVFLKGRRSPGQMAACMMPEVVGNEIHWHAVDRAGGERTGAVLFPPVASTGDDARTNRADIGGVWTTPAVYGRATAGVG